MKRGYLERHEDVSGVTGSGEVANFVINDDGRVVVFWPIGVGVWPSLEEMINVHGHQGKTIAVVLDDPDAPVVGHCLECHKEQEPALRSIGFVCKQHDFCPGCLETVSG